MNNNIYIVHKAWSDPMENSLHKVFGYEPIGYCTKEEVAAIPTTCVTDAGWAAPSQAPMYKVTKLPKVETSTLQGNNNDTDTTSTQH